MPKTGTRKRPRFHPIFTPFNRAPEGTPGKLGNVAMVILI